MSKFEPGDPLSTLWWCLKWGLIVWVCAWGFLACTGQLPSDPG